MLNNHYVKIWHVRLRGANNMHPISWGEGDKRKGYHFLKENVIQIEFDDFFCFENRIVFCLVVCFGSHSLSLGVRSVLSKRLKKQAYN